MDHARRANPHHPPGPPLRALLKTLQILIAPGGLPTGAGAATTQRQGASGTGKGTENSAWEIARRGLPVHADVIGKRLAAAGLCLKESLCEGDAGRNGSVTRDGERARGDSGNDVSDGVRGGAGGEVDGSGEYGGVVPNKELGLQTGGGGPPAYSSACSDTDNESDTGQSTPIPDLLVNAISLKTLLPLAFPIVPPSLPTFTSAPTATTPSSSSLDAAGPPIQSELPPHLSYSNGRPGPNTDQTHGTPEWSQARDKYQAMLGVAAIRVLVRMQAWLALEVGPGEGRAGLGVPDYTLGSWDLKLIRHALITVMYVLNTLCMAHNRRMAAYHQQCAQQAKTRQHNTAGSSARAISGTSGSSASTISTSQTSRTAPPAAPPAIKHMLSPLLSLLRPIPIPLAERSSPVPSTAAAASASTSTSMPRLPTSLALLVAPHMCPIILASLLIYYDPVRDAATYRAERAELLGTLNSLAPRVTLSALNGVLGLCRHSKGNRASKTRAVETTLEAEEQDQASTSASAAPDASPPSALGGSGTGSGNGDFLEDADWQTTYPPYITSQTSRLLTLQLLRAGGIRALLENTLPIDADAPSASAGQSDVLLKARNVAGMISTGPDMALATLAEAGAGGRERYVLHCVREAQVVFAYHPILATDGAEQVRGQAGAEGTVGEERGGGVAGQSKPAPRAWRVAVAEAMLQLEAGPEGHVIRPALADVLVVRHNDPDKQAEHNGAGQRDSLAGDSQAQRIPPTLRVLAQIRALSLLQGILQHASPTMGFFKRVIEPILDSLMLLVSPDGTLLSRPEAASKADTLPGPDMAYAEEKLQQQEVSKLARNVILLYTDLVEPLQGAEALYAACLINVQSGAWNQVEKEVRETTEREERSDAGTKQGGIGGKDASARNKSNGALTAWLDDVDRTQLLEHLAARLDGILGANGRSANMKCAGDDGEHDGLDGVLKGGMSAQMIALRGIRRVVLDKMRRIRESAAAEQ